MTFTFKHGDQPLAGYTIRRGVGRGGFGEVYYAVSEGGKEVALKYLRDNPQVELRGVSHCINLKSPHLVTIFDVKPNAEGEYFIIMEYVSGPSLRDLLIAEPGGLGLQKAAFFVREMGKGLSYLHDRGIVHRDLKPGNIFYEDGYVKIGDYGLAKFISVSRHSGQTASVGTVHYMAPEVGTGNYHRGIDIYAMGVILYEMLLGKVPFEGSTMGEVLMKHLTQQPEVDQLPAPFASVIRKALAKDPNERYQAVDEMVSEIFTEDHVRRSVAAFRPDSIKPDLQRAWHAMETQVVDSPARSPVRPFAAGAYPPPPPVPGHQPPDARRVAAPVAALPPRVGSEVAAPRSAGSLVGRAALVLLVVTGLTSLIVAVFGGQHSAEYIGLGYAFILAMSGGAGIAYKVLQRLPAPDRPGWAVRLVTLGCSAIPVLIVGVLARGAVSDGAWMLPAALGLMLCVDWSKRIYHGLQGRLVAGEAITAGICGVVLGAICGAEEDCWFMGAIAAATSLVVQAGAWFMPRRSREVASAAERGAWAEWYPHRRSFRVPEQSGLIRHAKRYFEGIGYKVDSKSRRRLQVSRGSKEAVLWGGDIRSYKTEVYVQVESASRRQVRVTCHYQVWTDRSPLNDEQLAVLDAEVSQLARFLGATEAMFEPGGAPEVAPAVARIAAGNWPPPPPPAAAAQPHAAVRKPRSVFARVFWSLATAGLISGGIALIVSSAFEDDDVYARVHREFVRLDRDLPALASDLEVGDRGTRTLLLAERLRRHGREHYLSARLRNDPRRYYDAHVVTELLEREVPEYELYVEFARRMSDAGGLLSGGLACLAFSLFTFSKTTRYKRQGFWRETFRPLLLCGCLAGIGASAGQLGMGHLPEHEMAPFIATIVFCGIVFLFLLAIRGKATPGPQPAAACSC